ncbi:hypothetical protein N7U66_11060 [Lacinutrix neustonica]|uniref:Uncharacterized protein n=1 Tax=Lacinutrix neustonica TaxID=2980107 RepID=A0A9E8MTR1_9FLAO|nr:hypothetical protein [Lacinutrix neustonica]WAC00819.1 hypothetical protein N7U66_11060 [Lacinutrix neustonica]
MPKLRDYTKTLEEGQLQVVAVALDTDEYRWKNMILGLSPFLSCFW